MDGFYEWQTIGVTASSPPKPKQPVYVTRQDGQPLAVAGLWASWRDRSMGEDAPWLHSCCVITTQANDTMSPIHDRMPVILEAEDWDEWLNVGAGSHTATPIQRITELMIPADPSILIPHWVSTAVNSVRNNHAELVTPIQMPS
jgi:putative SOS response-associated peptidase YedK